VAQSAVPSAMAPDELIGAVAALFAAAKAAHVLGTAHDAGHDAGAALGTALAADADEPPLFPAPRAHSLPSSQPSLAGTPPPVAPPMPPQPGSLPRSAPPLPVPLTATGGSGKGSGGSRPAAAPQLVPPDVKQLWNDASPHGGSGEAWRQPRNISLNSARRVNNKGPAGVPQ
jgi:hypothetical protein